MEFSLALPMEFIIALRNLVFLTGSSIYLLLFQYIKLYFKKKEILVEINFNLAYTMINI